MKFLARLLQEPLLHFLVLAAGLFALAQVFSGKPAAGQRETIVVSEQRVKSLILGFQRTWQRPPTQSELDGFIEDYIKEEVFYREALSMQLDRDDTLIRRRLRQKLEFLAENMADAIEPSDQQLQQYLAAHPNSYQVQRRTTFTQVFLSRERRGDSLQQDAAEMLTKLQSLKDDFDPADFGDPSLLPVQHENLRELEVASQFGPRFAAGLLAAEPAVWSGPIESSYGLHLVLVHDRSAGRQPSLDEVRDAVRRDWYAQRRADSRDEFFQALRQKYQVVVERPDALEGRPAASAESSE